MANFDEYRRRWVYACPFCNAEITVFRDCGELTPCQCKQGDMVLKEIIEPKQIECKSDETYHIKTFKPYFDVTLGREVTSEREIKEYCKKNNCVYAGDKELTQQCEQNKRENQAKMDAEITSGIIDNIMNRCF